MDARILCHLDILSGQLAFEPIIGNVLQRLQAYSYGCLVRVAPNSLSVRIASVHHLFTRPLARLMLRPMDAFAKAGGVRRCR